jgi:hypothetical protein
MSSRQLGPEWVLSRFISPVGAAQDEISELVVVARRLWPRIQVHARREDPEENSDEALILATEVCRENSPASKPEELANKKHGSLSFRCLPPQVQSRPKKGASATRDNTASPFYR